MGLKEKCKEFPGDVSAGSMIESSFSSSREIEADVRYRSVSSPETRGSGGATQRRGRGSAVASFPERPWRVGIRGAQNFPATRILRYSSARAVSVRFGFH